MTDYFTLLLNSLQGLCEWRDVVARAEDESTGYILPNKTLIEIGMWKLIQNLLYLKLGSLELPTDRYMCDFFLLLSNTKSQADASQH